MAANMSNTSTITSGRPKLEQSNVREVAVMLRGAVKVYEKNHMVLKGLDMTVQKGKIYGLLGPSGCGKSTLLSIIVGKTKLDSGDIMVKAKKRENIGYMPQDLNLHEHLTILQTYKFYGLMLNMDMQTIIDRAKKLATLLELPTDNRLIDTLSGGQQRRVSLGVALLHDPDILILDEPTVGLDPILSNSIWNHLVSFAEQGKTIIITTHYIEEAKQAHTIGMMREGVLVAEGSPEILMSRYNATTLEDAFLTLSHKQETASNNWVDDTYKPKKLHTKKTKTKVNFDDSFFRKNRFYSLLYKNLWLFMQEKSFSAFLILLPLIQITIFNLAIGHDPKMTNIAVVNKELQRMGNEKCMPDYKGCFLNDSQDIMMSCAFIEKMKSKSLNFLHYNEVNTALNAVRKNRAWGLLYFSNNYTKSLVARVMNLSKTSDLDLELSSVQTWIDFSDHIIANMVKSKLVLGMQEYLGEYLSKCNISSKVAHTPISFKEPVYGSVDTAFVHFASAAKLSLLCYFLPVLFTMGAILAEKKEGMMERMMVSGIKFSEVVASTAVTQMLVHAIQTAITMYIMYVQFDNPYLGSHLATITILMLIGMEGMIMGFLIGAICPNFMAAGYMGAGINIGYSFSSGLIWPLEGSHYLIRLTSPLYPINAPIKALLAITAKGYSFNSEPVIMGLVSIFCWSSIMIITIYILSKFKKDLWISKK